MPKSQTSFSLNDIVSAVVPAIEKALQPKFDAIDKKFDAVDRRFDAIDQRFDAIDKKFDAIDKRFIAIDRKFVAVDQRFDSLEARLTAKIDSAFNELAAMTAREFAAVHKEIASVRYIASSH